MTSVNECRLFQLDRIMSERGAITPAEARRDVPFDIKRVYYLYDLPAGVARAGHAHQQLQQLFVCVLGSFTIILRDGREERWIEMNRGHIGLYVPRMIWRELGQFSAGTICLVLASLPYDEADYIRDYREFEQLKSFERGETARLV